MTTSTSTLRQVLTIFEQADGALSLAHVARELGISTARLEGMLQYWVRKGRIREVAASSSGCPSCGIKGECPFVMALPRSYELAADDGVIPVASIGMGCGPRCGYSS
jgi:hypothetical protein